MQGRGMLKKPPRVRDNNGALQVRLRLDGRDHFINRLGRWDDPVAQAKGQAICAEIWRDAQQGDLDLSLNRYRPLVEGRDQDLLDLKDTRSQRQSILVGKAGSAARKLYRSDIVVFGYFLCCFCECRVVVSCE